MNLVARTSIQAFSPHPLIKRTVLLLPMASNGSILGWPKAAANGSFVGLAGEAPNAEANGSFAPKGSEAV